MKFIRNEKEMKTWTIFSQYDYLCIGDTFMTATEGELSLHKLLNLLLLELSTHTTRITKGQGLIGRYFQSKRILEDIWPTYFF